MGTEVYVGLLEWLSNGLEKMPEVVVSFLAWKTTMLTVSLSIFSFLFVASIIGTILVVRYVQRSDFHNHDDFMPLYLAIACVGLIAIAIIICNFINLSMIVNVPDMYLIKAIKNF